LKLDLKNEGIALPVDLIRTVAIVLVILLHASIEPYPNVSLMSPQGMQIWWASNVYDSLARVCIPLFVMLAGALLLQPSKAEEPLKVFFKKRLWRIGVPFLFWGATYFAWRFFVNGETLTANSIVQGVLTGPYYQFWFLYLILGLYLVTPVLRVVIKYADWKIMRYLIFVWFTGTAVIPLLTLFGPYNLNANVFIFTGWLGYFVLGAYLLKVHLKSSILTLVYVSSLLWTIIVYYLMAGTVGEKMGQFFYDAYSFNIILASAALFLLLVAIPSQKIGNRFPHGNRALKLISQNTLPIYLFHVIVLEIFQKGYLGFTINITTMNPIVEIPLITVITLLTCLAIIVPLKKIPYVKRVIG
jgi:surface polysaccharide O-acyltransferase-like enzyme